MSKEVFTASGQHNPDFSGYVGRNGATFYLRTWLEVKKDLINFVRGGLLEDDELDTLDDTTGVNSASSQTPSKTKIHKGNESLDRLASAFTCYVDDRKVEADRVSNSLSVKVQERAQILSILGDIRKQLQEIDAQLVSSTGDASTRLNEDRELLLLERQSWVDKLRANNSN
ncbi:hypothetical protein DVH05_010400 [Phytophthora capsici]|nr:hypothetical protein DVH05_010400 [Phytophthora capsici]